MTLTKEQKHYHNVHAWIKRNHGSAKICESIQCKGVSNKFQWAKLKECDYDYNINNFIQLCASCHRKYDYTEKQRELIRQRSRQQFKISNPMKKPETRAAISNYMKNRVVSIETRSRMAKSQTGKKLKEATISKISKATTGSNNPAARKVICTATGNEYLTVKEAAQAVVLKRTTLVMMLRGHNKNKTTLKYV